MPAIIAIEIKPTTQKDAVTGKFIAFSRIEARPMTDLTFPSTWFGTGSDSARENQRCRI